MAGLGAPLVAWLEAVRRAWAISAYWRADERAYRRWQRQQEGRR